MGNAPITDAQSAALDDLRRLSSTSSINVVDEVVFGTDIVVKVHLNTSAFDRVEGGLAVADLEELFIVITPGFPWNPPRVEVAHQRWAGFPHVLQGSRLCLYLDPATEWNPLGGVSALLARLWDWFADAIANRFDAATSLYQPVGGVFHRTDGAPTIVVTDAIGELDSGFRVADITLHNRTEHRVDVLPHGTDQAVDAFRGVLVVLSDGLPYGGGSYVSDLAVAIRGQDSRKQRKQFITALTKTARHLPADGHLHVLVAVPNQHLPGQARFHLIGWRLPRAAVVQAVDATSHRHQPDSPHPDDEPQVEWTYVDDNRTSVTTRRDHTRPIHWFKGKTVELWGCGALGSWIAEFLVRAGVAKITLRDTGYVAAGLLIRQNYSELDVGRRKVDALSDRLHAIANSVTIDARPGLAQIALHEQLEADAIIDCTVNTGVAVAIEQAQTEGSLQIPIVQIATDNDSATLGLLTVSAGSSACTTNDIDNVVRNKVAGDTTLTPYLRFWDRDSHPTMTPTIGCSVPTFHGAALDTSAIAAHAISLASTALQRKLDAGYLFASAHSSHRVPNLVAVPAYPEPPTSST